MLQEGSCNHCVWQMGDFAKPHSSFSTCHVNASKLTSLEGCVIVEITLKAFVQTSYKQECCLSIGACV